MEERGRHLIQVSERFDIRKNEKKRFGRTGDGEADRSEVKKLWYLEKN